MASGSSRNLANNNILFYRRRRSGATAGSGAFELLGGADGLALDFTDDSFAASTGFYGSAAIVGGGSQDGYNTSPDATAASLLTYTSPSVKMTMGPSGTLRFGAHNLCLQSNTFSSGSWTNGHGTLTQNVSGPLGVSGWTMQATDATSLMQTYQNINTGFSVSNRIYAKAGTQSWLSLCSASGSSDGVYFNLATGTIGTQNGSSVGTITAVGDGWYLCTISRTLSYQYLNIEMHSSDNQGSWTHTTADTILIADAHQHRTPADTTYLRTTSAARYALPLQWTSAGVLEGILVEEARTNLITYSEQFDNAAWTKANIASTNPTVSANAATAPDGTTTANEIAFGATTTASTGSFVNQITTSSAAAKTGSVWLKAKAAGDVGKIVCLRNATSGETTQVVLTADWVRSPAVYSSATNDNWLVGNLGTTYGGVDSQAAFSAYVWGAQLEAGSFATSYIPTIGSTVTRGADNISLATSAFPYGSSNSLYFEVADVVQSRAARYGGVANGTYTDYAMIEQRTVPDVRGYVETGSVAQANIQAGTAAANSKGALVLASNDFAFISNGSVVGVDASGTPPTVTNLELGRIATNAYLCGLLKKVACFPTRKTNAELQTLTS